MADTLLELNDDMNTYLELYTQYMDTTISLGYLKAQIRSKSNQAPETSALNDNLIELNLLTEEAEETQEKGKEVEQDGVRLEEAQVEDLLGDLQSLDFGGGSSNAQGNVVNGGVRKEDAISALIASAKAGAGNPPPYSPAVGSGVGELLVKDSKAAMKVQDDKDDMIFDPLHVAPPAAASSAEETKQGASSPRNPTGSPEFGDFASFESASASTFTGMFCCMLLDDPRDSTTLSFPFERRIVSPERPSSMVGSSIEHVTKRRPTDSLVHCQV